MFSWIIRYIKKNNLLPQISDTERAALEAGTVWVEGDLFSGKPDFKKLLSESYPELSQEEREFLDGPVEEVCNLVCDHEVRRTKDLPPKVWDLLREHRFFGLKIPKKYGGKGFSAIGCSSIFGKLSLCSMTLNIIVLIPNSIGPAELIEEYGTQEQKDRYLALLARGEEMPCFALTEPKAGSDAGAMTSSGTVFKKDDGKLYICLNWDKRYITLAPIATLAGLAFRLFDPENHLGKGEDLGITCALIDTSLPGVENEKRHDPMGIPFPNGPFRGTDVEIPIDQIIGGPEYAGRGWGMLMEALSCGRGVALPSGSAIGVKGLSRLVSAYTVMREQFGTQIGKFEGIQEPLARIGGLSYLMEATRIYTCGAVDSGHKPSVVSAIAKYHQTEMARDLVKDAVDVLGGRGICRGPRNPIATGYIAAPIAVTVEGANILTRTLIIFGQGLIRCHPYMYREVLALENEDAKEFRRAFFGHIFHVIRNNIRLFFLSLSRGRLASSPVSGKPARYYRKLAWASAQFAVLTDIAAAAMGSDLKRKGKLAGRFADILSWMYLATATLRRYEADGRPQEDLPFLEWSLEYSFSQIQTSFEGVLANFEIPLIGPIFRKLGSLWIRLNPIGAAPSDQLGAKVAQLMQTPGAQRDRLTKDILQPTSPEQPIAVLENAFAAVIKAAPAAQKIKQAIRSKKLPRKSVEDLVDEALQADVIDQQEADLLKEADQARTEVLKVDEFTWEEYAGLDRETSSIATESAMGSKN